jgi:hypothetical protein
VTPSSTGERVFDFSNGAGNNYMMLSRQGYSANSVFTTMNAGASNTQNDNVLTGVFAQGTWVLLTVRLDSSMYATFRSDGGVKTNTQDMRVVSNDTARLLIYIGRSSWPNDAYANMDLAYFGVWDFNMADSVFAALETRLGSMRDYLNYGGSMANEPAGTINMTFSTCSCDVGYYGTSTGCLACQQNNYCAGGIAPQIPCEMLDTSTPLLCTVCPTLNKCTGSNASMVKWTTVVAYCLLGLSGIILLAIVTHAVYTVVDHRRRYQILKAVKFQNGLYAEPISGNAVLKLNTVPEMLGNTVAGDTSAKTVSLPGYQTVPHDRVSIGAMVSETKSFAWFRVKLIDFNLPVAVKAQLDLDSRPMTMKRANGTVYLRNSRK